MATILPLALFAALAAAVTWLRLGQARTNRRAVLARLEPALQEGRLLPSGPDRWSDVLTGRRAERPVRIAVRSGWRAAHHRVEATLELRHPPPIRLRIRHDAGLAALEKRLGLARDVEVAGGDRFDQRYLVEVSGQDAGEGPLADAAARGHVHTLLSRWRLEEVAVEEGALKVLGTTGLLGRALLLDLLDALEVLARGYDRRPLVRRVAPAPPDARAPFAWVGGPDAAARCPYCHDTLASDVDLAACSECATVLHGECHAEHGSCPILGCTGRGLERHGPLPGLDLA